MNADKFSTNDADAASDPTAFVNQHQALFSYQTFKSEHSTFPLCLMSLPKCLCKLMVSLLSYLSLKFKSSNYVFLTTFCVFLFLTLGELFICFRVLFSLNRLNYFDSSHFAVLRTFIYLHFKCTLDRRQRQAVSDESSTFGAIS